jgi:hypothetical protein
MDVRAHWSFNTYVDIIEHMEKLSREGVIDAKESRDTLVKEVARKYPLEFLNFFMDYAR